MAYSKIRNVKLTGVAAAVPKKKIDNADIINRNGLDIGKISQMVGVESRHVADDVTCSSDLCYIAAEQLIKDIDWAKDTIDALIFVSQTPDFVLPASACILQNRLGISKKCAAFDIHLGCSGYVYGLLVAYSLVSEHAFKRVLLLVGDTVSKVLSDDDTATNILFGDAGTATAVEYDINTEDSYFILGTDGSGADSLIVKGGGFRYPTNENSLLKTRNSKDNILRSDQHVFMDGSSVYSFVLSNIPALVQGMLKFANLNIDNIDIWLFHQANKFILDYLINKLGISKDKFLTNMKDFGNTSPPSIPLLMVTETLQKYCNEQGAKLSIIGFGVGFSWGGAILQCKNLIVSDLLFV